MFRVVGIRDDGTHSIIEDTPDHAVALQVGQTAMTSGQFSSVLTIPGQGTVVPEYPPLPYRFRL
jgi:hypothetical protein